MRTGSAALVGSVAGCLLVLLGSALASAQEAPPTTGDTTEAGTGDAAPPPTALPGARPVPPVAVLPVASERVSPPIASAIRDSVAEALRGMLVHREVVALGDEATLATAAACTNAPCVGAIVMQANAIAGVIVRMDRHRPHDPVHVMIGVVDPVSGNPRGAPVEGDVPAEQVESPGEAIAAVVGRLANDLPGPPLRTTLLVASNVDGAAVNVDDASVGETPLPPGDVEPGRHVVTVTRPGFLVQRHEIEVAAGDAARLDFDLEPTREQAAADAAGDQNAALVGYEGLETEEDGGLLSKWWFWAAAGGGLVVVGVLTGVIIAVASSSGSTNGIPVPPLQ